MIKSISFPKIFNSTTTNTIENHDATLNNLKLLLSSEKGSLFGDPGYGVALKELTFNLNNRILEDILKDEIYCAILTFMPQIAIERKDIEFKKELSTLHILIRCTNKLDYTTNLYDIVLLNEEENR